jgi:hypothetical protein
MQIQSSPDRRHAVYLCAAASRLQRGRPRGTLGDALPPGVALVLSALALAGCLEPASPPAPGVEALVGAWQVVNGTRREACPDGSASAPFEARVWLWSGDHAAGAAPLWRSDEGSACELRFGAWADEAGVGAEILPGQACDEVVLDADGTLGERRIFPLSWTVRQLPGDLLWESYELHVVERRGKAERVCRVSAAATLARAGAVIR